jgi:hypothetical protein
MTNKHRVETEGSSAFCGIALSALRNIGRCTKTKSLEAADASEGSDGKGWASFQVIRRTHSTWMNKLKVDPKLVPDQLRMKRV